MSGLPSGTVTFLFTDLEGSTSLWHDHPEAMRAALARHDELVRAAIEAHGGHVVKTTGDGFHAAFAAAHDAVDSAVAVQLAIAGEQWGETGALRVRAGIHSGPAELREGDYYGTTVNRAARLMSIAHGGQVVVSLATSELVRDGSVELVSLGEHRVKGLTEVERVFQVVAPGLPSEFPPLQSLDAMPGNLPRQVTTFVGREHEVASLAELVRGSPVVTLTGVGGVGKTRLSLEVAAEVVPAFADGAWFCELAPVADVAAVWEVLAGTLRVQSFLGRSLEESVLEYLSEKRLLLVLDNCEHLLGAVARLVDAIVRRCGHVSVLATSREGLGVAGERMVAVPSLDVPAADADVIELLHSDAVQLFRDRASAAKAEFVLTERNAGAVGVLCRRLDGIPLAIELAAARVRSMSPDDLVARLDQRFKLLTKGSRAALERQQTLRATIDWSYDLLDPTERQALDRLSVFAGGCDLAAAEAVLADDDLDAFDVDDVLSQLVDKSLVVADDTDRGVRYRLLETIRQYAQEHLEASGDTAEVRRRHADYYVGVVESAGPHLRGADQGYWLDTVVADVDNLRAVLDWAIETVSPDHALRLVAPLALDERDVVLARGSVTLASEIPGADGHRLFPLVASSAALRAMQAGDSRRAEELLSVAERVQVALDTPRFPVLRVRAAFAYYSRDREPGVRWVEEWVELARASSDIYELSAALTMLGGMLAAAGRSDEAIAVFEEGVRVAREAGNLPHLANGILGLARELPAAESDRALVMIDEVIELATQSRNPTTVGLAWGAKARVAARAGDWPAVLRAALEAAEQHLEMGDVVMGAGGLRLAGRACRELGDLEPAAVLFGKADAVFDGGDAPVGALDRYAAANQAALVEGLGEQRAAELAARGAAMTFTEAVAYLRAEADRSIVGP